jgi:hypothetical protein
VFFNLSFIYFSPLVLIHTNIKYNITIPFFLFFFHYLHYRPKEEENVEKEDNDQTRIDALPELDAFPIDSEMHFAHIDVDNSNGNATYESINPTLSKLIQKQYIDVRV